MGPQYGNQTTPTGACIDINPLAPACGPSQTWIPPGGSMGPQYGNQVTPTGACIDAAASSPAAAAAKPSFCLFGDTSKPISASIPICGYTAIGILAAVMLLFAFGGRR